jgi:hypothetical protein
VSPDSPPLAHEAGDPNVPHPHARSRLLSALAALVALVVLGGAAALWFGMSGGGPGLGSSPSAEGPTTPADPAAGRDEAVAALLAERGRAVVSGDRSAFLAQVDPAQAGFAAAQEQLVDRLADVPLAEWRYEVTGTGPGLTEERATQLPEGSAIVRVRLTYRLEGTSTRVDREQFLTVVPRGGRWLLAGDSDAAPSGFDSQRDLWDLGPVQVVRGESSVVVADTRAGSRRAVRRLAEEADRAVEDVDQVWRRDWSRRPVVVLPRSQKDMATLIGSDGEGLAQIAAVTTGSFEEGLSRGDRVVINPAAFDTLGALGRRVVLSHEMTHVATRATSVRPVPIWLSEGFADYVAYDATPVPTAIVASDVLDDVRDGKGPRRLPDDADFDAGEGDIAASYEGAWLACRLVAERYGENRLVQFYEAMSDSAGPGWPEETEDVLGLTAPQLVREWREYLADKAAS